MQKSGKIDTKSLCGYKMQIIRSKRKTFAIEVKEDLSVLVRAPIGSSDEEISRLAAKHENWIKKHIKKLQGEKEESVKPLSDEQIKQLYDKAERVFGQRCAYYAKLIGVKYNKITIRKQKTRWGSCSANKSLSFNCLLMLAPPEVIDSVVVHELCHIKHMNHSKAFYAEIYRVMENYGERHAWLKENGRRILKMGACEK